MIPNPFWIVPILKPFTDAEQVRELAVKNGLNEAVLLRGAWVFVAQVIDDYGSMDLRDDEALGLAEDFDTNRAFQRDPQTLLPYTSPRARTWKRLQMIVEDAKVETTREFVHALQPLLDGFLSHVEHRFENMSLATGSPANSKQAALNEIALERLIMLSERADKFVQYEEPPGTQKNWAYLLAHRFPAYKACFLHRMRSVNAPRELVTAAARKQKFDSLESAFQNRPTRGPDPLTTFFEGPPSDGSEYEPFYRAVVRPAEEAAKDELHQQLLGRPFDILRSDASGCVALRSPALISLMKGELSDGLPKPLRVLRVLHPGEPPWYTYGVYIERPGTISDYSCWLIFDRIGSTYEGFAGDERKAVEAYLSENSARLDIRDVTIERQHFLRYFEERHPDRSYLAEIEKQRDAFAGRVLEYLTLEYYRANGYPESEISFKDGKLLGDREIDVLAINQAKREAIVVECTLDCFKPDTNRRDIESKIAAIRAKFPTYTVHGACVTTWASLWRRAQEDGLGMIITMQRASLDLHILEDHILPKIPPRLRPMHLRKMYERTGRPGY